MDFDGPSQHYSERFHTSVRNPHELLDSGPKSVLDYCWLEYITPQEAYSMTAQIHNNLAIVLNLSAPAAR